jgi:hypothetical protein
LVEIGWRPQGDSNLVAAVKARRRLSFPGQGAVAGIVAFPERAYPDRASTGRLAFLNLPASHLMVLIGVCAVFLKKDEAFR